MFLSRPIPVTPVERFSYIMDSLAAVVGSCVGRGPQGIAYPPPRLPTPLVVLILSWLRGIKRRLLHAFTTTPPPPRQKSRRSGQKRERRPNPVPRGKAWLIRLILQTSGPASQLRHLLTEPDILSLFEADPRLSRALRALCRALKIPPPPTAKPPPPPAPAPPPAPEPAETPPSTATTHAAPPLVFSFSAA